MDSKSTTQYFIMIYNWKKGEAIVWNAHQASISDQEIVNMWRSENSTNTAIDEWEWKRKYTICNTIEALTQYDAKKHNSNEFFLILPYKGRNENPSTAFNVCDFIF